MSINRHFTSIAGAVCLLAATASPAAAIGVGGRPVLHDQQQTPSLVETSTTPLDAVAGAGALGVACGLGVGIAVGASRRSGELRGLGAG
jgi:hypothetical protein